MSATIHEGDNDLRMLRVNQVLELFPISRVTLWRQVRAGAFPAPRQIGSVSMWSNKHLRDWLAGRVDVHGDEVSRAGQTRQRPARSEIDDLA